MALDALISTETIVNDRDLPPELLAMGVKRVQRGLSDLELLQQHARQVASLPEFSSKSATLKRELLNRIEATITYLRGNWERSHRFTLREQRKRYPRD